MEVVIQTDEGRYIFPEARYIEIDQCSLEIKTEDDPKPIVVIGERNTKK